MVSALIGLGVASAAYSIYRQRKSDRQVQQANDNNRYAADLSYKAQKETNDLNYLIFQEQQQYNSPANLKSMYDALGLNGSAIVANQGFTPTSAPQMVSPEMSQVAEMPFNSIENPLDKMMSSLMTSLSSEKMRAEIDSITKDMVYKEAQTDQCKQATELLIRQTLGEDLRNELTENDVQQINERNAELRLTVERLKQDVAYNPKLQDAVLRAYTDNHAISVLDKKLRSLDVQFNTQTLNARVAQVFQLLANSVKQGESFDLNNAILSITKEINFNTKDSTIKAQNASNKATELRSNKVSDIARVQYRNNGSKNYTLILGAIADALLSPLSDLPKFVK